MAMTLVGSASLSANTSATFSNIPQGFKDLRLVWTLRFSSTSTLGDLIFMTFNGNSSGYTHSFLRGGGNSGVSVLYQTGQSSMGIGYVTGTSTTSDPFSSGEIYISQYAKSQSKIVQLESVSPNNDSSVQFTTFGCGEWDNNSAITSLTISGSAMHGDIWLYGIS